MAESERAESVQSGGLVASPLSCVVGVHAPLVVELALYNFGHLPPGNTTRRHLHTFHQLDVLLQGRATHTVEGLGPRMLTQGDALLIPPMVLHESVSTAGYMHASFKMFLGSQPSQRLGTSPFIFKPSRTLMKLLVETGMAMVDHQHDAAQGVLAAAAISVVEAQRAKEEVEELPAPLDDFRRLVLPVLQPVDKDPSADWTVEAMAERCNLSVDYFTRCFRRTLKQTPKEYLLMARMRVATSELLATPRVAIKQVAHKLGYSSVQTFSRAFRDKVGMSPAAFRASPHSSQFSQYL